LLLAIDEMRFRDLEKEVATNTADVNNLVRWQEDQNGSIHRVESKVDCLSSGMNKLGWGVAATAVGIAIELIILLFGKVVTVSGLIAMSH